MGKSSLAFLLEYKDMVEGTAIFSLDPHDLNERIEDLCTLLEIRPHIIDPARGYTPVIDPFEVPPGMTRSQVVEILLMSLRSIWAPKQGWGEQTAQILRNTFRLCIELGKTFFDAYLFLRNPALRQEWIDLLPDSSETKVFWTGHMRRMNQQQVEHAINAPLDKLDAFFAIDSVRPCFQRRGSTIDFGEIMDNGEVCLLFLRRDDLATATELMGATILAKMHIAILQRNHSKKTNKVHWYLDEAYQYWNTSVVLEAMAEAAKFGLGVRLLSQTIHQYPKDDQIKMLELAGTIVSFRVKRETAKVLAENMFMYTGMRRLTAQQDFFSLWQPYGNQRFYSIQQEQQMSQNELMHQHVRECMVYAGGELWAAEVPEFAYPQLVQGEVVWHHEPIPEPLYLPEPEPINLGGDVRWLPPGDDADWR
jgi:hypothetical protein